MTVWKSLKVFRCYLLGCPRWGWLRGGRNERGSWRVLRGRGLDLLPADSEKERWRDRRRDKNRVQERGGTRREENKTVRTCVWSKSSYMSANARNFLSYLFKNCKVCSCVCTHARGQHVGTSIYDGGYMHTITTACIYACNVAGTTVRSQHWG